jgi:hypothetical protein
LPDFPEDQTIAIAPIIIAIIKILELKSLGFPLTNKER